MADKIFTGNDRAKELGFDTWREFIVELGNYREFTAKRMQPRKGQSEPNGASREVPKWRGAITNDPADALYAYVDAGRWTVQCECGEAAYAEPTDPLNFCVNCGNVLQDGKARPVIFPDNRKEIEKALLERKMVGDPRVIAKFGTQICGYPNLVFPQYIPRHWHPGQSPDDLREEHRQAKTMIDNLRKNEVKP